MKVALGDEGVGVFRMSSLDNSDTSPTRKSKATPKPGKERPPGTSRKTTRSRHNSQGLPYEKTTTPDKKTTKKPGGGTTKKPGGGKPKKTTTTKPSGRAGNREDNSANRTKRDLKGADRQQVETVRGHSGYEAELLAGII